MNVWFELTSENIRFVRFIQTLDSDRDRCQRFFPRAPKKILLPDSYVPLVFNTFCSINLNEQRTEKQILKWILISVCRYWYRLLLFVWWQVMPPKPPTTHSSWQSGISRCHQSNRSADFWLILISRLSIGSGALLRSPTWLRSSEKFSNWSNSLEDSTNAWNRTPEDWNRSISRWNCFCRPRHGHQSSGELSKLTY